MHPLKVHDLFYSAMHICIIVGVVGAKLELAQSVSCMQLLVLLRREQPGELIHVTVGSNSA